MCHVTYSSRPTQYHHVLSACIETSFAQTYSCICDAQNVTTPTGKGNKYLFLDGKTRKINNEFSTGRFLILCQQSGSCNVHLMSVLVEILGHKSTTGAVTVQFGMYTGCSRRNGQNFGRVFLMLKYTDITQNTYVQS